MDIKWKKWTARRPVKIVCIALIPIMAFMFLICGYRLTNTREGFSEELLFEDFSSNEPFFRRIAFQAYLDIQTVFTFQSEERIRNLECIKWEPVIRDYWSSSAYQLPERDNYPSDESDFPSWEDMLRIYESSFPDMDGNYPALEDFFQNLESNSSGMDELMTWYHLVCDTGAFYGEIHSMQMGSIAARQIEQRAIEGQLREFRAASMALEGLGGLYFYISDGERILCNAQWDAEVFRSYPVYILSNANLWEVSVNQSGRRDWSFIQQAGRTTYLAFSREAVDYQNALWISAQREATFNIVLMGAAFLFALAALVILVCGAGRRYDSEKREVCLSPIDKPWLDVSLVLLVSYGGAVITLITSIIQPALWYGSTSWVVALCALLSVAVTLPVVWWVTSLTKRCKIGKWWRHTMIRAVCSLIKRCALSLWAGTKLTARVAIIAFISFVLLVFAGILGESYSGFTTLPVALLITGIVTIFLLRYARRLRNVERGAEAAKGGDYSTPIGITGGELGSIAASIDSISEGINAAVLERMKSERLKTELITNVSHDIRTPLTSLITYTDLLKNEGLDSAKAPEYLDILVQKAARLKTLTDDLFEASKAASGSINANLETLDLADFVRQVLGELDERIRASGLDFRQNLPEHAPVQADGKLLWRVMENLLSNVFRYALAGSRVYIDVSAANGWQRLDIKNISEHSLNVDPSELTERFKRGDSSRAGDGSGLGLSIAQSFIDAQGGKLQLSIDGDLFKASVFLPTRAK